MQCSLLLPTLITNGIRLQKSVKLPNIKCKENPFSGFQAATRHRSGQKKHISVQPSLHKKKPNRLSDYTPLVYDSIILAV